MKLEIRFAKNRKVGSYSLYFVILIIEKKKVQHKIVRWSVYELVSLVPHKIPTMDFRGLGESVATC
jgi:hypothetical protein